MENTHDSGSSIERERHYTKEIEAQKRSSAKFASKSLANKLLK